MSGGEIPDKPNPASRAHITEAEELQMDLEEGVEEESEAEGQPEKESPA